MEIIEQNRRRESFPKTDKALVTHLQEALIEGKHQEAHALIEHCLQQGWKMMRIYRLLLKPVLVNIGELWHAGTINVAQEHLATHIITQEMNFVRELSIPTRQLEQKAVIASVQGSQHYIAGLMMADFLYVDGWQTDFLGANVPNEDLLTFVKDRAVDLVVLSINMEEHVEDAKTSIQHLKSLAPPPTVMLGGSLPRLSTRFPEADLTSNNLLEGLELIRQTFHLDNTERMQVDYLQNLGRRIAQSRKRKQWSQQQLAEAAKLDRTYISGAERGRQNLTIGAISKISDALGIDLEDLLVPR